eukprot:4303526-Pleurochrysis_carterae.AAC.1
MREMWPCGSRRGSPHSNKVGDQRGRETSRHAEENENDVRRTSGFCRVPHDCYVRARADPAVYVYVRACARASRSDASAYFSAQRSRACARHACACV